MANLFFPQLTSGVLVQYPVRRVLVQRSIKNILADGSMILLPDPAAKKIVWQLSYTELSSADMAALVNHFAVCEGRLQAFTFIDPTGNMLMNSANLTAGGWQLPSNISSVAKVADPAGGLQAVQLTNVGQAAQEIVQTVAVPSGYQYCFSAYVSGPQNGSIGLIRRGSAAEESSLSTIGPQWTRVSSSGRLSDSGTSMTVGLSLAAGQQISLYGPQLEAQVWLSRYCATGQAAGVYANAHWAVDQLPTVAEGPDLFGTAFTIEAMV